MKIERTKNASRNMIFGVALKIYQIVMPFLMRTAMIYFMGVKYLGLNSLFTSVLQVLNLAELGVGSAMIYSMYKPIVDDDSEQICALMKMYRTYYRIIGLIVAVLGVILLPFVPKLIKDDIPEDINVYVLYLFNLAATVFSYWLFAYKNSLLSAHQRTDISSKVSIITSTVQYGLQLLAICFLGNYYVYVLISLFIQIATNISTAVVVNKMYPDYKPSGKLDKKIVSDINSRIRDLFTSKIGAVIINSADTIVISAFLGLKVLAVYQNYFFILNSIIGIVSMIFAACMAGVGNSVIVETKEKNFNDLKKFTFIVSWISGFCVCCLMNLYQPFMKIWVKEDNLLLSFSVVICLCLYYYIYEINALLNMYKDAAGIWHEDRFRPMITAFANLGMNLAMVHFWGLYGVIFSTVLSMIIVGMPWLIHNLFSTLFEKHMMRSYVLDILKYFAVSVIVGAVTYYVCSFVNLSLWMTMIVRLGICLVVPNILFLLIYRKKEEFKKSVELADKMTGHKIKFLKKLMVCDDKYSK